MEFTGGGAGIMLALAAVLWLLYLVPSWFRRREYLATERNAVRLQQSLRILAETSEIPEVIRTESTARSVAAQERALRELEKRRKLEEKRLAAEARSRKAAAARSARSAIPQPAAGDRLAGSSRRSTSPAAPPLAVRTTGSVRAARLRRSRLLGTAMLLGGLGSMGAVGAVVTGSAWTPVLAAGMAGAGGMSLLAITLLNRLAAVSRSLAPSATRFRPTRAEVRDFEFESEPREWTPVPLPKPLYLSKPVVAPPVMADPREDERKAAAVEAGEVTSIFAAVEATELTSVAAPSKFAAMGHVDLAGAAVPDLEAVIRRRLNRAV